MTASASLAPAYRFSEHKLYVLEQPKAMPSDISQLFQEDYEVVMSCGNVLAAQRGFEDKYGGKISLEPLGNDGHTYKGQIIMPPEYIEVPILFTPLTGRGRAIEETQHPPEISIFGVQPAEKFGYMGALTFDDRGGDLSNFLIAVDGQIYRKGRFIRYNNRQDLLSFGKAGEFLATSPELTSIADFLLRPGIQIQLNGQVLDAVKEMPIACSADREGNLYSHSSSGINAFGELPEGGHMLAFYMADKRGNRAFAVTEYEL